jgi:hypothetical protein
MSTEFLQNMLDSDNVQLTDQEQGLKMYHYTTCDNDSPDLIKQTRGIILDNDNNLVLKTMPFTSEYSTRDVDTLRELLKDSNFRVYKSIEGTYIRVFYYGDKWFISTHRRINAFKCRWASRRSFGSFFRDGVQNSAGDMDDFFGKLDKTKKYVFLLRSAYENKIASTDVDDKTKLYHVGTYDADGKFSNADESLFGVEPLESLPELTNATVDTLMEWVDDNDFKCSPGLILFLDDGDQTIKITHPEYLYRVKVRGNMASIRFRYLCVRHDEELCRMMYNMYPKFNKCFNNCEEALESIGNRLYNFYVNRYIQKKYVDIPRDDYIVVRKCHDKYLNNKAIKITQDICMDVLGMQHPTFLNRIIRKHNIDKYGN